MKYRADIDGLRAIAVLLVLFYHAHFAWAASGFIGVDIFFVISGFLITQIIVHEVATSQKFNVVHFYQRRLWRLMPVFVALLIITSIATAIFYLPVDFLHFTDSARHVARFNANTYFSRMLGGYFSPNMNFLPLLHTWSLAIEWQWYAILPFFLFVVLRVFDRKFLIYILGIFLIISIMYAMYLSVGSPTKNYYRFGARVFELLMGAFLVALPVNTNPANGNSINIFPANASGVQHTLLKTFIINGLAMIALAVILMIALSSSLSKQVLIGFPNQYAVLVCGATAILIYLGQLDSRNIVSRFLMCRPLVWIGLGSYSLYIWHWPIFAIVRYLGISETIWITLGCLAMSGLLALISWHYLEKRARHLNQTNAVTTLIILVILPIMLTQVLFYTTVHYQGFPNRFNNKTIIIDKKLSSYIHKGRAQCMRSDLYKDNQATSMLQTVSDDDPLCTFGADDPIQNAYLIGDSFGNHYWGFMDVLAKNAKMRVRSNTSSGCLALPDVYVYDWNNEIYYSCYQNVKNYYQLIKDNHFQYVILGQRWSSYLGDQVMADPQGVRSAELSRVRFKNALEQALQIIIKSGARPVIFEESFSDPINGDNLCFYRGIKMHQTKFEQCNIGVSQGENNPEMHEILRQLQEKFPELIVIDPKIVQCPNGVCPASMDGLPIYEVTSHLNDFASYKMGRDYLKIKGNPFKMRLPERSEQ